MFGSLPLSSSLQGHFGVSLNPHSYNIPKPQSSLLQHGQTISNVPILSPVGRELHLIPTNNNLYWVQSTITKDIQFSLQSSIFLLTFQKAKYQNTKTVVLPPLLHGCDPLSHTLKEHTYKVQYLRFSQQCCWEFVSSGMWCSVVGWLVPDASEKLFA